MVLSPEGCSTLAINTHKGLFQATRLQFGVHSASVIFQRGMENFEIGSFVKIQSDILISGKNHEEHFKTLETALKIISNNGLKLKLKKYKFIQLEVTHLGYQVNKDGICPLLEKVDFIKNALPPRIPRID